MATTHASKEVVWLQILCSGIGFVHKAIRLYCNMKNAIFIAKNLAYHANTKHIDVHYHILRDIIDEKKFFMEKG